MSYFLTFSTYGTHLLGDPRGSTHRHEGRLVPRPAYETSSRNLMKESPFRLSRLEDRQAVFEAILEVCRYREWRLIALHVRTEHVHGLVQAEGVQPHRVMGDWKAYGSRALRKLWPDRTHFWTSGGDTRGISGSGVNAIARYILAEQGEPMETFDATSGQIYCQNLPTKPTN